jgi:anthranilate phosphoribosyltransferase
MSAKIIQQAIQQLIEGNDLSRDESRNVMNLIMQGKTTEAQIAGYLIALRMKGETVDEITGAVEVMRANVTAIKSKQQNLVDTCGTGGDSLNTFNISTAAAFIAAGAGIPVAKHGNKSVSSKCGSADVLTALGVNIDIGVELMEKSLSEVGIAFLFAPKLHPSMKYAMPARHDLGVRTVFNLLGPLTNPAKAKCQLLGVYHPGLVRTVVEVLKELGSVQVIAVHGFEGMDEISISGKTKVCELIDGEIYDYEIKPEDFHVRSAPIESIQCKDIESHKKMFLKVLKGIESPALHAVLLNAGAAIRVGGKADSINEGIIMARDSIDSGAALKKLEELKKLTNSGK